MILPQAVVCGARVGDAAEHVVFWVIDLDGIDLLVNVTYPTELAEEFEPMLDAFVASIEFE